MPKYPSVILDMFIVTIYFKRNTVQVNWLLPIAKEFVISNLKIVFFSRNFVIAISYFLNEGILLGN